jgi:thioredoxin-like negative regulator of GroEL
MAVQIIDDAAFTGVLANNAQVVVKYYADWCGSCKLFSPKYKNLSNDPAFANVAFIEVNAEHSPLARQAAGVSNLPFVATFRNGRLVEGIATNRDEAARELITRLQS